MVAGTPGWGPGDHALLGVDPGPPTTRDTRRDTERLAGVLLLEGQIQVLPRELLRLAVHREIRCVMVDGIAHYTVDDLDEYRRQTASRAANEVVGVHRHPDRVT